MRYKYYVSEDLFKRLREEGKLRDLAYCEEISNMFNVLNYHTKKNMRLKEYPLLESMMMNFKSILCQFMVHTCMSKEVLKWL